MKYGRKIVKATKGHGVVEVTVSISSEEEIPDLVLMSMYLEGGIKQMFEKIFELDLEKEPDNRIKKLCERYHHNFKKEQDED